MKKLLLLLSFILCTLALASAQDDATAIYPIKKVSWVQSDTIPDFRPTTNGINTISINKNVIIVTLDSKQMANFLITNSKILSGLNGEEYNLLTGTLISDGSSNPTNAESYTKNNNRYLIINIGTMTLGVEY